MQAGHSAPFQSDADQRPLLLLLIEHTITQTVIGRKEGYPMMS